MADDITNTMLLEHIHAMKADLLERIASLDQKLTGVGSRLGSVEKNMLNLTQEMRTGFEEARQHRQALQEDLEATMRMLAKHEAKLARL